MKKTFIAVALFLGFVGVSQAGGRQGQGWIVTIVTGTHKVISDTPGVLFLKGIVISSGVTTSLGNYVLAYSTPPSSFNGADGAATNGGGLMGGLLFSATAQVLPALVYKTTSTVSGISDSLNNSWSAGDSQDSYIEVPDLTIRQSVESSGEAGKVQVIWSR